MRNPAERFFPCPSVEHLGAAVPERDHVAQVAHEHRVVSKIEQPRPFLQRLLAAFSLGDLGLDACAGAVQLRGALLDSFLQLVARRPLRRMKQPGRIATRGGKIAAPRFCRSTPHLTAGRQDGFQYNDETCRLKTVRQFQPICRAPLPVICR